MPGWRAATMLESQPYRVLLGPRFHIEGTMNRVICGLWALALAACGGAGSGPGETEPRLTRAPTNSGDGQTGPVGALLQASLRVQVLRGEVAAEGVTVDWAAGTASGEVNPASSTTDASGIALAGWTLGTLAGQQTARATLRQDPQQTATFTATAQPGLPATFDLVSLNNQAGDVGTSFSEPLLVRTRDAFANGIPGQLVNWDVTQGSAILSATQSTTGSAGTTSITASFGPTPGAITIRATPASGLPPVLFNATARALPTAITIEVRNNVFLPAVDTVAVGGTVTWSWVGSGHTMTATPPPAFPGPDTGIEAAPFSYQLTFTTPGTYNYRCTEHPPGMVGSIVVR